MQKFSVSSTTPKILTQVGAIRKQLQAARFFDDVPDGGADNDDADYWPKANDDSLTTWKSCFV